MHGWIDILIANLIQDNREKYQRQYKSHIARSRLVEGLIRRYSRYTLSNIA